MDFMIKSVAEKRDGIVITLAKKDIPDAVRRIQEDGEAEMISLDDLEARHIRRVMGAADTLEEAARILGINLSTLWRKRRRLGLA